jgi:hypothetical protein
VDEATTANKIEVAMLRNSRNEIEASNEEMHIGNNFKLFLKKYFCIGSFPD